MVVTALPASADSEMGTIASRAVDHHITSAALGDAAAVLVPVSFSQSGDGSSSTVGDAITTRNRHFAPSVFAPLEFSASA
jgi:hypothetical protein